MAGGIAMEEGDRGVRLVNPASIDAPERNVGGDAGDVLHLLDQVSRQMDSLRVELAEACSLRPPVWNLLHILEAAEEDGMTVSEAAKHLGVRPQALSGPANEMVADGLLERKVDSRDGRARRLRITDRGRQRLTMGGNLFDKVSGQVLEKVPQASVARLVLSRLKQALESSLPERDEIARESA